MGLIQNWRVCISLMLKIKCLAFSLIYTCALKIVTLFFFFLALISEI